MCGKFDRRVQSRLDGQRERSGRVMQRARELKGFVLRVVNRDIEQYAKEVSPSGYVQPVFDVRHATVFETVRAALRFVRRTHRSGLLQFTVERLFEETPIQETTLRTEEIV